MYARCLLAVVTLVAACGGSSGSRLVGNDVIDRTYTVAGGSFDSGGDVIVAAAARDFGGRLAICGARIQNRKSSQSINLDETVLESSSILINGETVMRDLRALQPLALRDNMAGQPSRCFATDQSWSQGAKDLTIKMLSYRTRSSRSREVNFVPGPVPQIIGTPPSVAPTEEPARKPGAWERSS